MKIGKILVCVVSSLFLLTACGTDDSEESLSGESPPIPALESTQGSIEGALGGYCWDDHCVDAPGAPEIFEHEYDEVEPYPVQKEEELTIDMDMFPDNIGLSVMEQGTDHWMDDDVISDEVITAPSEKGIYYFNLCATWGEEENVNEASATYAFIIEVE